VQREERVDEQLARAARVIGGEPTEDVGVVEHDAVDVRHEVERRAVDVDVIAEHDRSGDGDGGAVQRADHAELAGHVVGGGEHVPERRTAQRPRARAVRDLVREVRQSARDHRALQRSLPQPGRGRVEPHRHRIEVQPRKPAHPPTLSLPGLR